MVAIDLTPLQGFFWVARAGSYSAAARQFPYPITQPGLHKQVKRLEAGLGVRLLVSAGRSGAVLTPEGRQLLEFIGPFFEQLPGVLRSLSEGPLAGELHVETSGLVLRHILPNWLRDVRARFPSLLPRLSTVEVVELRHLLTGEADIIVDYVPEIPAGLESRTIARARPFLVFPLRPSVTGGSTLWRALRQERWIGYPSHLPHSVLQRQALAEHGVTQPPSVVASSAEDILALVSAGLGFSIVPWLGDNGPKLKRVAVLPMKEAPSFPIRAVWRPSFPRMALIDALLTCAPTTR